MSAGEEMTKEASGKYDTECTACGTGLYKVDPGNDTFCIERFMSTGEEMTKEVVLMILNVQQEASCTKSTKMTPSFEKFMSSRKEMTKERWQV